MNLFKSSFLKRVLSSVILIPPIVFILTYDGSQLPVIILLIIASLWASYEWQAMARRVVRKFLYLNLGNLYIIFSFTSFYLLYEMGGGEIVLILFVMIWASDVGAYFFGKLIGGPKMMPNISPNKTLAGLVGALVMPAFILSVYSIFIAGEGFSIVYILAGGLIGLAGQGGDLLISFVKRKADLKDTGALIPGHGGLLDRIDSMMLATPVALFIYFFATSIST